MRDWNNFFRIEDFAGLTVDNGFGQESFLTEKSASEIADRANALLREEVGKATMVYGGIKTGWDTHKMPQDFFMARLIDVREIEK